MSSRRLRRIYRADLMTMSVIAISLLVAVAMLTALLPRGATAQIDENTYVNPTYGYQIEWDPDVWEANGDGPGDLALRSDLVEIYFQSGQFYAGDATACRDDLVDRLPDDDTVLTSEPYEGDGEQSAEEDGRAFSTLQVELDETDDRDARTVVERIDCRTLVAGEAVLAITWLASVDDASEATESAQALLDALVILSFQGQGADVNGLDGGTYVDPALGFSLSWDESDWTSFVPVDAIFGLNSTISLISFSLPDDFDGDAASCVESSLDDLSSSPGIVDVAPIERDGQEVAGLDDAGWSYAAIDANYGGTEQFVEIRCAAIPGNETTLRAVHSGPIDSYEGEADLAAPVFASLLLTNADPETGDQATPEAVDDTAPDAEQPTEPAATPAFDSATPVPSEPAATPSSGDAASTDDRGRFTSVEGEWTLAWDETTWQLLDPALYATVELALGGESSVVTLDTIDTEGRGVDEILAAVVDADVVGVADEGTDVERIDSPPVPSDDAVGEAYRSTTAGGAGFVLGVVVVPLGVDEAVVVRIYGSADSLSDDYDAIEELLSGLVI